MQRLLNEHIYLSIRGCTHRVIQLGNVYRSVASASRVCKTCMDINLLLVAVSSPEAVMDINVLIQEL